MKILKIDKQGVLDRVIGALRRGEVVVLPTDTVYGLIADAANEKAVRKIFDIKGRPKEKAVSLFVRDIRMAKEYAEVSPKQEKFLERIWPGKVTVILGLKTPSFAKASAGRQEKRLGGFKETIGMRAPKDEFLQKIIREMGAPLAQTSANLAGKPPARNVKEISEYFSKLKHQPVLCVDGGERSYEASSVVDLSDSVPAILREGAVSKGRLFELFRDSGFSGRGVL